MGLIFALILVFLIIAVFGRSSSYKSKGYERKVFSRPASSTKMGREGEEVVSWYLGHTISGEKYVFNDYLVEGNNTTSQIDHIVVNSRGVFVIETKNYSGAIYGSEQQGKWTQVLAGGSVKNTLYNPVKQNKSHIYYLKKITGNYNIPYHSVIVFVQGNIENIHSDKVISPSQLKSVLQNGKEILTSAQIDKIGWSLLSRNKRKEVSNEEHIHNIKVQQSKIEHGICPRCGGRIVLRNGKYGLFYGCSNYPKCKFKKGIDAL